MSRKTFIESHGATCKNWYWSWSFINESKRLIIFGAWDVDTEDNRTMIFSEKWRVNGLGHRNKGYDQSREHIRLIEEEGYHLMTFPMQRSKDTTDDVRTGPAKIGGFTAVITEKVLERIGSDWFATDSSAVTPLAEELATPEKYPEGARCSVTINAYERNPKARAACVAHHGYICAACEFDFAAKYGTLGKDFIHVHHIKSIGKIGKQYEIDPKEDLIPVCPNCHAMIHRPDPPLTVKQLRKLLQDAASRGG